MIIYIINSVVEMHLDLLKNKIFYRLFFDFRNVILKIFKRKVIWKNNINIDVLLNFIV